MLRLRSLSRHDNCDCALRQPLACPTEGFGSGDSGDADGNAATARHRAYTAEPTRGHDAPPKATQKATHIAPKAAQKASQHPTAQVRNASFDPRVTPQTQRGCAARCERTQPRAFFFSGRSGIRGRRRRPQEALAAKPPRAGAAGTHDAHEAKQPASRQAAGLLSAVGGEGFEPP